MVPMTLTREHPDPAREKERTPLAYELAMKLEAMATAAHVLTNQADELKDELDSIARQWRELSSTWTGVAASAYQPPWQEWYSGAATAAAILEEHSQLLMRSVDLMLDHENTAAKAFEALYRKGPAV
ncbi:WXG100 type VII secretion target family protein [Mycobacterium kansasii 824]|nr:WXG100 type VII secretion target family protein [Mycobacterium kansasii 824]